MLQTLKSAFPGPRLQLLLKSGLFGAALGILKLGNFGAVSFLFFFAVSAWLWLGSRSASVATLAVIAAGTVWILDSRLFLAAAIALFSLLVHTLIGVREVILIRRKEWGALATVLMLYAIFFLFFLADKSASFAPKQALAAIASFFIIKDWIRQSAGDAFPKRQLIAAFVLGFITAQFLWAVALLPLGVINAASMMTAIAFIGAELIISHFRGKAHKRFAVQTVLMLCALCACILAATAWHF